METIVKTVDRKGDKGTFRCQAADDASTRAITFLTGKSHVGADEYSNVTTGVVAEKKVVVETDVTENDIDFSCIIRFKDRSNPADIRVRSMAIPAPILNQENGICAVMSDEKLYVPAIPPDGSVGLGGNSIVTAIETLEGATAGNYVFISGSFQKTRR